MSGTTFTATHRRIEKDGRTAAPLFADESQALTPGGRVPKFFLL